MINERNAMKYCKDDITKIENYQKAINDTETTWECHHRWELTLGNELAHDIVSMKRLGMYYARPYFELIFLPASEHIAMHNRANFNGEGNPMYGTKRILSECTRRKISLSSKGRTPWNKGLKGKDCFYQYGKKLSTEAKAKISNSRKKYLGCKYFNNSVICVLAKECPEGFVKGRLPK